MVTEGPGRQGSVRGPHCEPPSAKLVLEFLREAEISESQIATVFAPAGLDLGAATPEEIALSVMSQMVALRRGNRQVDQDVVIRQCEVETTL